MTAGTACVLGIRCDWTAVWLLTLPISRLARTGAPLRGRVDKFFERQADTLANESFSMPRGRAGRALAPASADEVPELQPEQFQ